MRHILIFLAGAAVAAIWAVSAICNYTYGFSYGLTPDQGYLFGGASVASDVLKAGLTFAIPLALYYRRYVAMLGGVLLFTITTGYSLSSAYGFASTNIFKSVQPKLVKEQITKIKLDQIKSAQESQKWLEGQSISKSRSHRKMMVAEVRKNREFIASQISELEKNPDVILDAHPHATSLANILGVKRSDVLTGLAAFFMLLIEAVSALGFFVLFRVHQLPVTHTPIEPTKEAENIPEEEPEPDNIDDVNRAGNVVKMQPRENPENIQKRMLDQWFNNNVAIVKHPCIQAKYAYKDFRESTGLKVHQNVFYKYMRERLPENKIKRIPKGLHYYIAIKDQAAMESQAIAA